MRMVAAASVLTVALAAGAAAALAGLSGPTSGSRGFGVRAEGVVGRQLPGRTGTPPGSPGPAEGLQLPPMGVLPEAPVRPRFRPTTPPTRHSHPGGLVI
jgi:hypothetical protein